ncbi:hypothetical protein CRG98_039306 [Punica granatum]|uniref:Major facilitator superfamily (MFS) profile domain-containing protein n=1 Tax=Punica granatum TaxID=22663 RepID=A0A2I0I8H6_PUNGR|nr:hypothetical protein CRG98_039306 [Punica granatum]
MAEHRNPLLLPEKKDPRESCPGCKVDRLKEEQRGIPYKNLSYIWLVMLCNAMPISSLFPFIYFMIRDFHITKREEDIGFYAGFVGSSFMVGRGLTSVFWGMLADRYGRKPVILIGTFSIAILNVLFGLSTSLWMALVTRFPLGCFNGLVGTVRVSTSRGIGLVIGPAIGGFFAQPAENYPTIFAESSIFGRFPYFLPCLLISVYAFGVFICCWWLPETLHMHNHMEKKKPDSIDLEVSSGVSDGTGIPTEVEGHKWSSKASLWKNWPLMSTVIVFCVFSLQEIAYNEVFSLWAVSDKKFGGLSFSSQDVGEVLAVSGLGLLLFQLLLYPPVEKILGPTTTTRLSAAISIPILASYPFISMMSGLILHIAINFATMLRNLLSVSAITGIYILLNNAVPQHQRAAANGFSTTAISITKAFGPASAGALRSDGVFRTELDPATRFGLNLQTFPSTALRMKGRRSCDHCFRQKSMLKRGQS